MRYDKKFKEKAVKRVIQEKGNKNTQEIARELGVCKATLYKWVQSESTGFQKEGSFTPTQQLKMLKETYHMNDEELNAYCRKKGIFAHQLKEFEESFLTQKPKQQDSKKELEEERLKNKQLAKELRRKEKALAETAALLVLQKKFQALFQDEE